MSGWSVGKERKGISGSPSIPASALKGKDISRLTAAEVELLTQQGKRAQKAGFQAKARKPAPGRAYHTEGILNETEYRYAMLLDERVTSGEILAWEFEKIRLVLAPRTTYTPDFMVFKNDGTIEFHEVKGGHWEDDARVKIKPAPNISHISCSLPSSLLREGVGRLKCSEKNHLRGKEGYESATRRLLNVCP